MKQQYAEQPSEIEVYSVGDKTDIILRKNIEAVSKTEYGADGESIFYTDYECDEKQIRYDGTVTKEEIEADFDSWWNYEKPATEPEITTDERIKAIQEAQEAQDEVLAEILLSTLTGTE